MLSTTRGCMRFSLFLISTLGFAETCWSDLYTEGEMSLEWVIDSSDVICSVRLIESDDVSNVLLPTSTQSLKGQSDDVPNAELRLPSGINKTQLRPNDEWLYFLRSGPTGSLKLVKAIDLARPTLRSHTAAIDAEGKVLSTKGEILAAVRSRLESGLSADSIIHPELVQQTALQGYDFTAGRDHEEFVATTQHFVGGFRKEVTCDHWDRAMAEPGETNDLLITHLVVPADKVQRKWLLATIEEPLEPGLGSEYAASVYALVNYPSQEVRDRLNSLAALNRFEAHRQRVYWASVAARNVLRYWRFVEDMRGHSETEQNEMARNVIGVWRVTDTEGTRRSRGDFARYPFYSMKLFLRADHSVVTFAFSDPVSEPEYWSPSASHPHRWHGTGYWYIGKDSTLTVVVTGVDAHEGYRDLGADPLTLLDAAKVGPDSRSIIGAKGDLQIIRISKSPTNAN